MPLSCHKPEPVSYYKKALPSWYFDKYEYELSYIIRPPGVSDSTYSSPVYFKLSGEQYYSYFKVDQISREPEKSGYLDISKWGDYRGIITSSISKLDTIFIYERGLNDSLTLYRSILNKKEIWDGRSVLTYHPEEKKGEGNIYYYNLDWKVGDQAYFYDSKHKTSYAVVSKSDSIGLIDASNNIVIPLKYQYLKYIGDNKFLFGYKSKYFGEYLLGVITTDNHILISPEYKYIIRYLDNYIVKTEIDSIIGSDDGGVTRAIKSVYGLFSNRGEELIPCQFDYLKHLTDTLIKIEKNDLQALFNSRGQQLTLFKQNTNYKTSTRN